MYVSSVSDLRPAGAAGVHPGDGEQDEHDRLHDGHPQASASQPGDARGAGAAQGGGAVHPQAAPERGGAHHEGHRHSQERREHEGLEDFRQRPAEGLQLQGGAPGERLQAGQVPLRVRQLPRVHLLPILLPHRHVAQR